MTDDTSLDDTSLDDTGIDDTSADNTYTDDTSADDAFPDSEIVIPDINIDLGEPYEASDPGGQFTEAEEPTEDSRAEPDTQTQGMSRNPTICNKNRVGGGD